MRIGDHVMTPLGGGRPHAIEGDLAIVEMEYSYLAVFSARDVRRYR